VPPTPKIPKEKNTRPIAVENTTTPPNSIVPEPSLPTDETTDSEWSTPKPRYRPKRHRSVETPGQVVSESVPKRSDIVVGPNPPDLAKRKCNLIFFNMAESEDPVPINRLEHDKDAVKTLLSNLLEPMDDPIIIKQIFRLGSRSTGGSPRPLKAIFASAAHVKLLLSRGRKLKGSPISMRPDLSPEDRSRMKAALEEKKKRTDAGEKDLIIVNFRVVRKRLLLREPLVLGPATPHPQNTEA
jgi:hypothetical protein